MKTIPGTEKGHNYLVMVETPFHLVGMRKYNETSYRVRIQCQPNVVDIPVPITFGFTAKSDHHASTSQVDEATVYDAVLEAAATVNDYALLHLPNWLDGVKAKEYTGEVVFTMPSYATECNIEEEE